MDNVAIRITGLVGATAICIVALALGEMNFAYSFGGLFGAILGLPFAGSAIKKLVRP